MTPSRARAGRTVLLVVLAAISTGACFGGRMFVSIGTAIDVLPGGAVTLTVGRVDYFYHRGMFFRPHRWGFVAVPAPVGALVVVLPPGHMVVRVDGARYHYYHGVFYEPTGDRYRVVRPPLAAFVPSLPESAVTRRIDGVDFKEYAGTYYRPAIQDGRRGYIVAEPPERR